jgi:hypothetical protein
MPTSCCPRPASPVRVRDGAARCARWSPTGAPPVPAGTLTPPALGLAEWLADRQQQAEQHAERARAGTVAERRVAEALRGRTSDTNPSAGHQEPGDLPAEQERDRPGQEHDGESEDDFSESWRTYRGARRAHPPDLRLDGARAVAARRALAPAGLQRRPRARGAAGPVAPLVG